MSFIIIWTILKDELQPNFYKLVCRHEFEHSQIIVKPFGTKLIFFKERNK